ncbi:MAG: hypothetical protein PUF50_07040 [Erysipelotrichaceae bacterium]|nr:hypothetical protein [Erysipelotrichaceae bacterium]
MHKVLFTWLTGIIIITCCTFLCHMTLLQSLQYHLYDQQQELAYQLQEALNQQKDITSHVVQNIDIETNQNCFVVVYDSVYAISYTNATYKERPLTIPLSLVISPTDEPLSSIYTPDKGLRFATVSLPYDKGHVIVGKSTALFDSYVSQAERFLIYLYGFLCMITFPLIWVLNRFGMKE